ncbi:hypothetical protein [Nonomuraea dietziae]|uniref:hypothetical protein n=1 Tax=Nonomuraea dietziae TaxID=65515 RepID=UPI0031DEB52A
MLSAEGPYATWDRQDNASRRTSGELSVMTVADKTRQVAKSCKLRQNTNRRIHHSSLYMMNIGEYSGFWTNAIPLNRLTGTIAKAAAT